MQPIEEPLIYTFFEDVKSFDTVDDFYSFCIKSCKNQNLALDIGADFCEGLVKNCVENTWQGEIFAFDLWKYYEPPIYENVNYIKGDAIKQLKKFFKKNKEKIDLVQFDIRQINLQKYFPDDIDLDTENFKTEEIMEMCFNNFDNGSVIIITEFHRLYSDNYYGEDAHHFANVLSNKEVGYKCIAYCKPYPLSAWIIDKNNFLYKDDLKNLLNILSLK